MNLKQFIILGLAFAPIAEVMTPRLSEQPHVHVPEPYFLGNGFCNDTRHYHRGDGKLYQSVSAVSTSIQRSPRKENAPSGALVQGLFI